MAKISYPNSNTQLFSSKVGIDSANNDTLHGDQNLAQTAQQFRLLLHVARMRRRSQRQLLVQIEQEQQKQQIESRKPLHGPIVGAMIEISHSCSGTITVENDDPDEENIDEYSLSSSNASNRDSDDS